MVMGWYRMFEVESWSVLNFFTSLILILLLMFPSRASRIKMGRMYTNILTCTLVLNLSEVVGRIGEVNGGKLLFLAKVGYLSMFLLDPIDILFAIGYVECWMDDRDKEKRNIFKLLFVLFAVVNVIMVLTGFLLNKKWFFYFEDDVYYRGEYFFTRASLVILFIVLVLVYALVFRRYILPEYKNIICILPILAFVGGLLQVFLARLDTCYAGLSIACLIMYFYFQSNDVNMDYLTGVLNRRGLDIKMEDMVKESINTSRDFSAIMMDIDNFKGINDTYGHEAGDKAIIKIASLLVSIFGHDSYIGRFGGDEFCILTRNISEDQINEKLGETHSGIKKLKEKHGWPEDVDISCGFEIYNHKKQLSANDFAQQIDRLMYNEKQQHHKSTRAEA